MGQNPQLRRSASDAELLAHLGCDPVAAAAFRMVAARRAPALAQAYAEALSAAYARESLAILPPRWNTAWPESWRARLDWGLAQQLGVHALRALHPAFGRTARAIQLMGRIVRSDAIPPQTQANRIGPPTIFVGTDASTESAMMIAHELGHAVQMSAGPLGPSRLPPRLAAAELAAHVAERALHRLLPKRLPARPAAARIAGDLLVMLVRHPARDELEQASTEAWPAIALAYAPGHAWAGDSAPLTERALEEPLSTLVYAMSAAAAIVVEDALDRSPALKQDYYSWVRQGPEARFAEAAQFAAFASSDPAFYERAYDLALEQMAHVGGCA